MRRFLLFFSLVLCGCDTGSAPPGPAPAPAPAPPLAPAPPPAPPRLTEAELEAVLAPARRAQEDAGLSPTLPLTLRGDGSDDATYESLVDLLLTHLRITRVRIGAHTDPRGSEEYNRRISQERAEGVARALVDRGIACTRIEAVGYGESAPIEDAPMSAQRRIELRFVQVDATPLDELGDDICP